MLARLNALERARPLGDGDEVTTLRLGLLAEHTRMVHELLERDRQAAAELERLVAQTGSTLPRLCGLAARSVAELLVEVGDPLRFTESSFARFNGTAPLDASSAEGAEDPVRHRLNRGGNRRVNAILYRMAITQMQWDERARRIVADCRQRGHTKREAVRVLKRHLSNVIYRRMVADAKAQARPTTSGLIRLPLDIGASRGP